MKLKHFLLIGILTLGSFASAQEVKKNGIEVTGVAEMEVEPDEIIFSIGIKADNKNDLADNEKKLFEILKSAGVKNEDIKFKSMYQNIYSKTAKFSKNYQFKIGTKSNISKIFEDLNQKWVSSLNIAEVKSTKIADFRKAVKINALKAAKEKADYLLESMGKKTGSALEIVEIEDYTSDIIMPSAYKGRMANVQMEMADAPLDYSFDNIENIKLKYSIKTRYEIL
ncbi:SIMPL domain-containing protein [Chryseobacterium indologenes]|uniref:SIMPL domain-containing protein n=1 Tax=Chryseobacterium indologenes TaxID=253 RepID=UPI000F4E5234|nr:SIMPL domain-containing protein [Chryseobacterium indologenes]AYZ36793.1 SIMPL domain-containing protein [Chryseobacterium indologenes]MBF6645580.1 SIMPL domain-containing protein [Chryseobacterium indologenes]MBU3046897.1 SIMPL domain-containing protein [Chryseobacterium indologenes]MEB4760121.1 SIMPL domain-containing protein [Chryseobacterium indologenes]QQQ70748.1 SIMPL domain-containing protein [Chryseobacterium indologenes]